MPSSKLLSLFHIKSISRSQELEETKPIETKGFAVTFHGCRFHHMQSYFSPRLWLQPVTSPEPETQIDNCMPRTLDNSTRMARGHLAFCTSCSSFCVPSPLSKPENSLSPLTFATAWHTTSCPLSLPHSPSLDQTSLFSHLELPSATSVISPLPNYFFTTNRVTFLKGNSDDITATASPNEPRTHVCLAKFSLSCELWALFLFLAGSQIYPVASI